MSARIGLGYDLHILVEGRKLFLGGIEIPYPRGLLGHSDGDALLHAVTDALLGAAALGDIGGLFPDSDPKYKGIDSAVLLSEAHALARSKGYRLLNLDTVIIAQEPRLFEYKAKIQKRLADILGVKPDCIGIKAKTNEGMDSLGRKEAIAAQAVVLLEKV